MKIDMDTMIHIAVIVLGSFAHAGLKYQQAKKLNEDFTWIDFTILVFVSGFAGFIFGQLGSIFFTEPQYVNIFSGIGAFLGVAGLNSISAAVIEFLHSRTKK